MTTANLANYGAYVVLAVALFLGTFAYRSRPLGGSPGQAVTMLILLTALMLVAGAAHLLGRSGESQTDLPYFIVFGLGGMLALTLTGLLVAKAVPVARREAAPTASSPPRQEETA